MDSIIEIKIHKRYYQGEFWIANEENIKISGVLYIDKNGVAKIVSSQSLSNKPIFALVNEHMGLVVGYVYSFKTRKAYSVKLYNTYISGTNSGSLNSITYKSTDAYISAAIDKEEFNSFKFRSILL